ncbi:MAG TPA: 23S rRNA (guanosine(2251)-2'-O)-methyltransferase RlmB [Thermomicrobiales bacterium]|nr:23S rRNA (guanosine(2251)-2'-O)-methyltransferase RlmB [Thermomicrobiales bacterium]
MRTRRPGQPGAGGTKRNSGGRPERSGKPGRSGSGRPATEHGGGRRQPERRDRPPRRDDGNDLLYGRNAVREALRAGRRRFIRLLVNEGAADSQRLTEIVTLARQRDVGIETVSRDTLDAKTPGQHQGVVLEASTYPYAVGDELRELAEDQAILLALDGIADPQNLGTLLRTAEATGVRLIVIPSDRAAQVTPAVVNASAGAVEHLHVAQEVNLTRWLGRAKDAGFWIVGMDGEDAEPLFDTSMRPPVVLVVGSEGSGIRRLVRETCDIIVALPMLGRIESLNAAVAGSIGLYEIVRDAEED